MTHTQRWQATGARPRHHLARRARTAQRDHRRRRRRGRRDDVDRRDFGAYRRHRDPAARPRRGRPAVRRGLVLAQRQRRDDRHHLDRRGRIVQSSCRAVEYARGRRLPHRRRQLGQPGQSTARPAVAAAGLRRDLGRLPQRHQRRPRPARTCRGGARRGDRWSGGRGIGRRRNRDELLRIQGRQRNRVAAGRATGDATFTVGSVRAGELRLRASN